MKSMETNKSFRVRKLLFLVFIPCLLLGVTHCGVSDRPPDLLQAALHYDDDALEPYITAKTVCLHYGKHHAGYVARANRLLAETPFKGKSSREIIMATAGNKVYEALFNNVAQAWNHDFFWKSMTPGGGGEPTGRLAEKIVDSFGSYATFKKQFDDIILNWNNSNIDTTRFI